MGRAKRKWTEALIERRIRLGRGAGSHEDFQSWFEFLDVSSRGTTTRSFLPELRRTVLTFSNLEYAAALYAVSKPNFLDYRDQVRMCRDRTRDIADRLGVRHPRYRGTTVDCVMTFDGVLTLEDDSGHEAFEAYDCKWSTDLSKLRTQEIQAIYRTFCEEEGWTHRLICESTFPDAYPVNLGWIRIALLRDGEPEPVPGAFTYWPQKMFDRLANDLATDRREQPLHEYCTDFTRAMSLPLGFGLRCAKLLLWQRWLTFPMSLSNLELRPISALTPAMTRSDWIPPVTPSQVQAERLCSDVD